MDIENDERDVKMKEKWDFKFIVGMLILIIGFGAICGGFWNMVGKQAAIVKEEEAREEANAVNAMYIEIGEFEKKGFFVDLDSKTVFTAEIPDLGIMNKKGRWIKEDVLQTGDEVRIYGEGLSQMDEKEIAVYENVTKMQRIERATLEQVQPYLELVDQKAK
ncbi:MAG: hypothetical protein Q4B47_05855 [Eubacteriales bacterium]|nr:hypothetical protein [Eubacteriales bacterium]